MARPLRINIAGGWYAVSAYGIDARHIYTTEVEYERFLELLSEMRLRFQIAVHGYVLLPDHFHLVLQTTHPNLSAALQWLKTSYSMWFNRRHSRVGPLFVGRFKAIIFEPQEHAWEITRHLHLNPIRAAALQAGQAEKPTKQHRFIITNPGADFGRVLNEYKWSSYSAYVGGGSCPVWLSCKRVLEIRQKSNGLDLQTSYRQYVEQLLCASEWPSPWQNLLAGLVLGPQHFLDHVRSVARGDPQEQPALKQLARRPDFAAVVRAVEQVKGESFATFRDKRGDNGREMIMYLSRLHSGMSLKQIADAIGNVDYPCVGTAIHRFRKQLEQDPELKAQFSQAVNCLPQK